MPEIGEATAIVDIGQDDLELVTPEPAELELVLYQIA